MADSIATLYPGAADTLRIPSIALWHRQCGWFIGSHIELKEVELAQPRVDSAEAHAAIFGVPVNFIEKLNDREGNICVLIHKGAQGMTSHGLGVKSAHDCH